MLHHILEMLTPLKYNMVSLSTSSPSTPELKIHYLSQSDRPLSPQEGLDVIQGFQQSPKTLPPRYFYDEKGSQLFEQICEQPEYYPTRTEANILAQYAPRIAQKTGVCELIELGSGSSTKTRLLLAAYDAFGQPFTYIPIDVSAEILVESANALLTDYHHLQVEGLVGTYEEALDHLPSNADPRLVMFLGSTLGNFKPKDCDRFFAQLTSALQTGDYFLLGVDLQKPKSILEAAYNDREGVTAAFNLNMLNHLNWRFSGNFDPSLFQHRAIYNETDHQIEMYLDCQQDHTVRLEALDLEITFTQGESIHTEISRKFDLSALKDYLQQQGLTVQQTWTDSQKWFGVLLCQK